MERNGRLEPWMVKKSIERGRELNHTAVLTRLESVS